MRPPTPLKIAQGPFQRFLKAQADFQKAVQAGTEAQLKDAELNLKKAKEAVDKASRPSGSSFGSRLLGLVSSTRVGFGGGSGGARIAPLVGRIANLFGGGGGEGGSAAAGMAGKGGAYVAIALLAIQAVALAFRAAVTVVHKFVEAIEAASVAGKALYEARLQSGGSTGGISFLSSLGLSPASIPGLAGGLRDRMAAGSGNPFAMIAGRQLGSGVVLPKQFAPGMDEAGLLQTVVKGLANIQDASARFRMAVQLDATALLPSVEFYQRHRAAVDADAAALSGIADSGFQSAANDLVQGIDRVRQNFLLAVMAFAKPFMKPIADFVMRLGDRLRDLAVWINANQAVIVKLRDGLVQLAVGLLDFTKAVGYGLAVFGKGLKNLGMTGVGQQLQDVGKGIVGAADWTKNLVLGGNNLANSMDANTQALMGNTAALHQGTFGGGDRTRRAVGQRLPGYLEALQFDRAVAGQAYRLGAF